MQKQHRRLCRVNHPVKRAHVGEKVEKRGVGEKVEKRGWLEWTFYRRA
jgi:hypothetical protein